MPLAKLTVQAGKHQRSYCPVEAGIELAADVPLENLALLDEASGQSVPVQAWLGEVIPSAGYYERALARCTEDALALLRLIVEQGGTSGSLVAVSEAFTSSREGLYYYPAHRMLTRLGLAYAVDSTTRDYYLLPEGLVATLGA